MLSVYSSSPLSVSGLSAQYCLNDVPSVITGSDISGTFNGPGFVNSSSITLFDPALAGVGTFNITFSVSYPIQCMVPQVTYQVTVNPLPVVTNISISPPNTQVCLDSPPITLSAIPSGGSFSGTGESNGVFYPRMAGLGSQLINYFYKNASTGCSTISNITITVFDLPQIEIVDYSPIVCNGSRTVIIGNKFGGKFSGLGIISQDSTSAIFDSALTGIGVHQVNYSFTDTNGCSNTVSVDIIVFSEVILESSQFLPNNLICQTDQNFTFSIFPPSGNLFSNFPDPSVIQPTNILGTWRLNASSVEVGTYSLFYNISHVGGTCSQSSYLNITIVSVPKPVVQGITSNSKICYNSNKIPLTGIPDGGVFSGTGIVDGHFLDPSQISFGNSSIEYQVTNPNGCNSSVVIDFEIYFSQTLCDSSTNQAFSLPAILGQLYFLEI